MSLEAKKLRKPLWKLMVELFKLSKVNEGEDMLIVMDPPGTPLTPFTVTRPGYTEAMEIAADVLGATANVVVCPQEWRRGRALHENFPELIHMMKRADILVNAPLSAEGHHEALKAGVRSIMIAETEDVLWRHLPAFQDESVKRRTKAVEELLAKTKEVRVVSKAGTDLSGEKDETKPVSCQYGAADEPGKWDNAAGGFNSFYLKDESINGTVVIDTGDECTIAWPRFCPPNSLVTEPVKLHFKEGYITKIEGGYEAKLMRWWFEEWHVDGACQLGHFGPGANPLSNWWGSIMDMECMYGNLLMGIGHYDPSHCDIGLLNVDWWIDGEPFIKDMQFVHPYLKNVIVPGWKCIYAK